MPVPRFCVRCGAKVSAEKSVERARPQRELVERLWREGKSCREICDAIGYRGDDPSGYICTLRAQGYDLPHRRVFSTEHAARCRESLGKARAAKGAITR